MITKKKTIKSIIGCSAVCSTVLMAGVGALTLNKPNYEIYATGVDIIPVSISNSNFNSNTSSNYPYAPNSYTAYSNGNKVESTSNTESNINAGVINLSQEKYETRFSAAKRDSLDNYVLMIDSADKDDPSKMHDANYGFQTSSTIKLDANSKYMFTVDVFTATNGKIANLYLFDKAGNVFSSITKINSYNTWTTYTFFVSTNNMESLELKLGMYLEGAGTVLFDNISGCKMSESEYDFTLKSTNSNTLNEKNLVDNVERRYYINSAGKLEYMTDEDPANAVTSIFNNGDFDVNNQVNLTKIEETDGQNKYAVLLKSENPTFTQYETSDLFTFEQNRIYKVSVNVKTKNLNGTASLELFRTDLAENDEKYDAENHNKTIKITSNTTSSTENVTNDYQTYSFLINTPSKQSVSYKLKFSLGLEDALTSGEIYLSEIEISKIDYETFNSATTGSGTEKINYVKAYANNAMYLNNADFNAFKISDYNAPMPAAPVDWTVSTGSNKQAYGVVNTQTLINDLANLNLSNLRNPSTDNNNVLMMYNETADKLSYTSASKNLSAKTYHKFTVYTQTQNAPLTISLVTKKDDKEVVLSSKTVDTNYAWETVTLYLHTGYQAMDVSLKLTLDTTNYGYAYVDDTTFDYNLTQTQLESEFKSNSNSTFVQVADLTDLTLSATNNKFEKADLFTASKTPGVQSGTITLNSNYLDEVIDYEETPEGVDNNLTLFNSLAESETNKKVLSIWSTEDVNYTLTSNVGFKITSGTDKYYKVSVDVFTQNIDTTNNETNKDLIGAGIKLTGFSNNFTSIKSNNAWTTYTFYLQGDAESTTYLELSLGSEDAKTKGSVFFGNISFIEDVKKSEFDSVVENDYVKVLKNSSTTTEDDKNDSTANSNKTENKISKTTWIYLIPGLLTALAIIIAIVGFAVRKIKWKKPTKKSKTAYDRNKTVSVQYYSRKATTLREEKVRELTADLNKINEERKQYEEVYKKDLTKLREMKIKRANPAEIAKLEKDMKKNQKLSSSLGVTANRIADELAYTKTDAYLSALMKKLSRETTSTNTENK